VPSILACDPGAHGAFVLLHDDNSLTIIDTPTIKVPVGKKFRSRIDTYQLTAQLQKLPPIQLAVMEQLHSRPQQSAQSQYSLGHAVGVAEMAIASLHVPTHFVLPQVWQKAMGVRADISGDTKGSSRARAQALFPRQAQLFSRVKDDGRADAALMALYGREFV
jgi:crossover junction endodeoxyribonuclease RuvC